MNKKVLIIGGVILAIVVLVMYSKKSQAAVKGDNIPKGTPLQEEYYSKIMSAVSPMDGWVTDLIAADLEISGDKVASAYKVISEVAPNPEGKYRYNFGGVGFQNILWPESQMAALYNIAAQYRAKKAGL